MDGEQGGGTGLQGSFLPSPLQSSAWHGGSQAGTQLQLQPRNPERRGWPRGGSRGQWEPSLPLPELQPNLRLPSLLQASGHPTAGPCRLAPAVRKGLSSSPLAQLCIQPDQQVAFPSGSPRAASMRVLLGLVAVGWVSDFDSLVPCPSLEFSGEGMSLKGLVGEGLEQIGVAPCELFCI